MLKLGDFVFHIDDYPEELPLGGSSIVTVEKYPGGWKSIQDFGAFDDTITMTGTFNYTGALDKVRHLDQMWRNGAPVQLVVGSLMPRWVKITSFKPVYRNDFEIPYTITLERLSSDDQNAILYGYQQAPTSSSSGSDANSTQSPQRTYTVQAGDTLWGIAAKSEFYGDGSQYTKVVSANNIKDPSTLQVGQVLIIP